MKIRLELLNGSTPILWRQLDKALITIGCDFLSDICVPHDDVAPLHAELRLDSSGCTLVNRAESGTMVGTERVVESLRLADGDCIKLGHLDAVVRFYRSGRIAEHSRHRTLACEEVKRGTNYAVTYGKGHKSWPLDRTGVTIGTDNICDIVMDDPYISKAHARIYVDLDRCIISDLGSRNGVLIAGLRVKESEVIPGTDICLGKTQFRIVATDTANDTSITFGDKTPSPIGSTDSMLEVRASALQLARHDAPVLITGETGTGKDIIAQLIAKSGSRCTGPLITINCSTLSRTLIESELFGHERGAFTGATARKIGAFEAADGGTLFLDEIGELPVELQPQLLRALETGEIRRVGSTESFRVNTRIIAATNRQLDVEIQKGNFREDLFHRLHVLAIHLPPLRERADDIPLLTRHFIEMYAPDGAFIHISPEALQKVCSYSWPGNVRDLRNTIQRAIIMRKGAHITAEDITFPPVTTRTVQNETATSSKTLYQVERDAIVRELIRHGGNRTDAASALGISRSTIHRKIEDFAIDVDHLTGDRARP